jgi:hypothetical protein
VFGNFLCATFNNLVGNLVGEFLDAKLGEKSIMCCTLFGWINSFGADVSSVN